MTEWYMASREKLAKCDERKCGDSCPNKEKERCGLMTYALLILSRVRVANGVEDSSARDIARAVPPSISTDLILGISNPELVAEMYKALAAGDIEEGKETIARFHAKVALEHFARRLQAAVERTQRGQNRTEKRDVPID